MEIREILTILEGLESGVRVLDQDYDLDQIVLTLSVHGQKRQFAYTDYDEDFDNAERGDVFAQLQERPWYRDLDHPTKMEILDAAYRAIRGLEPQPYEPTVGLEPMDVGDRLDEQGVAEATGNPGMPHDFTAVQPGAEVWYKGRFAGWATGKVYDDPYGKHGKMVAFEPNPSEFPGDEGRTLSLPYDEVSLRKSTSIGKLKGPKQGVAEGSDSINTLIQRYEDMVELVYDLPPGAKKNLAIRRRDRLEAQIESMPGGDQALRQWAKSYNDSQDLEETQQVEEDPVARIERLAREMQNR